jgi:hypothetical protein
MAARRKSKRKPGATARIYYGINADGEHLYWTVAVTDARRDVTINGTLADAMAGRPGTTIGCHLSKCTMRNAPAFPHAVKFASFTKTTALIVDRISKGTPVHAVRYGHSCGHLVDLNDKDASKGFVRAHPELVERTFVLRMPKKRRVAGSHGGTGEHAVGEKRSMVARGALRRAQEAGLITADLGL